MSALLDYLVKKKDDRGLMADLRCALVESKRFRAYPHLGYFGGIGDEHEARVKQTVAGLFASHPEPTLKGNIGSLCFQLCSDDERNELRKVDSKPGTMAKRLQYLIASNRDEICERVKRIVLRAKAEGLPVNYVLLESDLIYWGDNVKTRWATSFWASGAEVVDEIPE
ncbi:MAG: type I-E CRISPR-associated protein Cse2/CasB [Spirochaetes bacterium]|jgi:CRISPR system Cascade subunit CasB|nr:type I-E CRISPR-associated protein Cse2/CasB [Spirochaetota bacterium]